MANSEFKLDIDAFKEVPFEKYPKDFTFIVNGKEYKTSRIIADFLSPIISQYHNTDATIDQFSISTLNSNPQIDFSRVLSLISFQSTNLSKEENEYLIEIFSILGNKREFIKLLPNFEDKLTKQNVFTHIQNKQKYFKKFLRGTNNDRNDFREFIQTEIDFISSHFYEIDQKEIEKLDLDYIEEIIKSDKLVIEDEDSLIKFINDIYSKNSNCGYLYSYINFVYVSNEKLRHFSEIFDLDDINIKIWKSILNRIFKSKISEDLIDSNNSQRKYKNVQKGIPLLHKENDDFNGIIKYLTNKTGGNIHDNGTINMTSSAYYEEPKNLLDFNQDKYYQTKQYKDGWVTFDFKNRKVKISGYSIKTNSGGKNGAHMKSWKIEVSNDGQNWTQIDERINCQEINGSCLTGTFNVQPNDFSRYVRLTQTDNNWRNDYAWFYYMEFYGYLQE